MDILKIIAALSHIPHFGDATTSPAGDAASPAGDVTLLRRLFISICLKLLSLFENVILLLSLII